MVPADDARSALQEDAVEFAVKVGLRVQRVIGHNKNTFNTSLTS